jgi:nucleoside-diphosphate-sugar epimerase
MKIFITGASGYIGGSVAAKLIAAGHQVSGLVRSPEKAAQLTARGIEPVLGALGDRTILGDAARRADAVLNTADSDHLYAIEALLAALEGSGKRLVHTSGSSVIADRAAGEASDRIFHEDTPFEPLPERLLRVAIDRMVLAAAQRGVHSVVLRPTMIYGRGHGLNPHSVQVPKLIALARKNGVALHVGAGRNIWSNVHIDDVVDAYLLALGDAPAGSLFYLENGEASWKTIAEAVSRLLGYRGATRAWPIDDAVREMGSGAYTSFGSNSRVRATKARKMLGWAPKHDGLLAEIERGCYREELRSLS